MPDWSDDTGDAAADIEAMIEEIKRAPFHPPARPFRPIMSRQGFERWKKLIPLLREEDVYIYEPSLRDPDV